MIEAVPYRVKIPSYSLQEELFNSISHGLGALGGIVALVLMLMKASTPLATVCAAVFGATIIIEYTLSCVYHALPASLVGKRVLRVFDHCGVFLLVFGTYVPASLVGVGGTLGWVLFGIVALFTIVGITLTAIDVDRFSIPSVVCHLVSGWSFVFGLYALAMNCGLPCIGFVFGGGLAYSIGAALYGLGRDRTIMHCVFHVFCLLGTVLHFIAIYAYML